MQPDYPGDFSREQGFSAADWQACLPGAVRGRPWRACGPAAIEVELDGGRLQLGWQVLPPRRIALISLPRLQVHYRFDATVSAAERRAFMTYFDLYTQRGGG